ncbi:GTP cyclohydrolase II [Qipengyuania flava]|uniref:GTP cyclohydrolase II n=1 Tax=Qipengyuania flava TaxID=192812 RepID=UPI001C58354D|nr:GTP cyclohydrolase II [Qipengyuania flava]MBW3167120.1 GTP cyclohydrolase II [Qipengyuania flava]MBY5964358.1 GTP cyclohydrolase II [Qipengyuania flava]MBY6010682.1 GTP cyclohydrolase II [Qipengyuania flava]MBY6025124.1 GTP cyclohydrolase II [Qipengyuania flava]
MDALRHGWPLAIDGAPLLQPVETAFGEIAAESMLLSATRAATLKLANQIEAAVPRQPVLMRGADAFDLPAALAVADPALDMANPLKGPFKALSLGWETQARAALELARIAGILPAFMVAPEGAGEAVALNASDVDTFTDAVHLQIASRAKLPVVASQDARIVAFRSPNDTREHVALIIGEQRAEQTPLVRLHSECLTGDVLGSLKCDCGPQLDAALHAMADEAAKGGWGVLLYMRQEGRGIGIINKLRAYRLQDQGFDTVDANTRLGLPDEARDFPTAARMLELLKIEKIRLMTNNPAKVEALAAQGIAVTERVAHALPDNPHNAHYLATKRDRSGHLL